MRGVVSSVGRLALLVVGTLGCSQESMEGAEAHVAAVRAPLFAACTGDPACPSGEYCSANGICLPQKAGGRLCEPQAGADCLLDDCAVCATGFCAGNVCCDSACEGGCSSCASAATGVPNGTCAPVLAGTDPKDACAPDADPDSCGADGTCNGSGACSTAKVEGTRCKSPVCLGSDARDYTCNGSGQCVEHLLDCEGGDADGCVFVAPDGDNAAALASGGATPFRDIPPAIDFADANRHNFSRVCVAAGATCGAVAEYSELGPAGLVMQSGISLFGKYESSGWTRCSDSVTRLRSSSSSGVSFGSDITNDTTFDGFAVELESSATDAVGIHVSTLAPAEITISDSDIAVNSDDSGSGIYIQPNAEVTVSANRVRVETNNYASGIFAFFPGDVWLLDNEIDARTRRARGSASGIACDDCLEVRGNTVSTSVLAPDPTCLQPYTYCSAESTAAIIYGSRTLVENNDFEAGCGTYATGLVVAGNVRVENNFLSGGPCPSQLVRNARGVTVVDHYAYEGVVDIHSNLLDGGGDGSCTSSGIAFAAQGGSRPVVRNNLILPGDCSNSFNVDRTTTLAYPDIFENNDLAPGAPSARLYRIQGDADPQTIEAVNAQPGHAANFIAECSFPLNPLDTCVNAGTAAGAPNYDYELDPRDDGFPDVGPDEL